LVRFDTAGSNTNGRRRVLRALLYCRVDGRLLGVTKPVFRRSATHFHFTAKLKPSPCGEYELTDAIRDLAQSGKRVKAIELTGEWADVRDPEVLAKLNQRF
jgi:UTP-glucose-1-phosphate uridylyltransferase